MNKLGKSNNYDLIKSAPKSQSNLFPNKTGINNISNLNNQGTQAKNAIETIVKDASNMSNKKPNQYFIRENYFTQKNHYKSEHLELNPNNNSNNTMEDNKTRGINIPANNQQSKSNQSNSVLLQKLGTQSFHDLKNIKTEPSQDNIPVYDPFFLDKQDNSKDLNEKQKTVVIQSSQLIEKYNSPRMLNAVSPKRSLAQFKIAKPKNFFARVNTSPSPQKTTSKFEFDDSFEEF